MGELAVSLASKLEAANLETERSSTERAKRGIRFPRYFTNGKVSPYDELTWERRNAVIGNEKGKMIFEQADVEMPTDWSMTATNIVASKYFYGKPKSFERETSLRQLIGRVVNTIAKWGEEGGYFATAADVDGFRDDLAHLMLTQKACFNSPVWFNVGTPKKSYGYVFDRDDDKIREVGRQERRPQCSACFINSVQDNLQSILTLALTEGMLFKFGSGTGTNLSSLREANAPLSDGGRASGPMSFMRGYDAFAGVIKSGGTTRRAAKMVVMNIEHPDVEEFIMCKAKEEKKAWTLVEAGYDAGIDGEAYSSIFFQNANNSVRVTDEFMRAAEEDADWWTKSVAEGHPVKKYKARDLLRKIAEATHQCGDPGMQFDTTVNRWHTSKNTARINASNPCSEYMFLDDSACNLASLNLMKFLAPSGTFDVEAFRHAVDTMIVAQEILVDNASYPTERIAKNSHDYRPLGLGFANLGAMLMASGLPYDSESGRNTAAAVSAVMHGQSYLTSSRLAAAIGPCAGYPVNREPFLGVIRMHREAVNEIRAGLVDSALMEASRKVWDECLESGERHGYRNAQVTVIAPTGTIGFMMDCDTTGIEPDLALVKHKKLVGGGFIKIVNNTVPAALLKLGYTPDQVSNIVGFIDKEGTIEGAPHIKAEHLPVFDCSFKPQNGTRYIHHMGHVKMMAAVQPFVSGAISKTVNLPEAATVEDIAESYLQSWKMGLKAVAIYRDGSKKAQPLSASSKDKKDVKEAAAVVAAVSPAPGAARHKLPDERKSITHKFSIAGHEGYITVGMYEDGTAGEVFITMAKEGSTVSGLMDSFATAISLSLQYGVPLKVLVDKMSHLRFEPSGWTNNKDIPYAKSIMDYIFRWLGSKFIGPEYRKSEVEVEGTGGMLRPTEPNPQLSLAITSAEELAQIGDAPTCSECGSIMTRNGSCYKCGNCGGSSGCS
jgi:ribonucleoside-diphosphate reductase alpha chain